MILGQVPVDFSGLRKSRPFFEASCGVEDGGLLGLTHLDGAQRYLQDVDGRYLLYDRNVYIYIYMTNDILDIYTYNIYIYIYNII